MIKKILLFATGLLFIIGFAHAETGSVHSTSSFVDKSKQCPRATHYWSCSSETNKCICKERAK